MIIPTNRLSTVTGAPGLDPAADLHHKGADSPWPGGPHELPVVRPCLQAIWPNDGSGQYAVDRKPLKTATGSPWPGQAVPRSPGRAGDHDAYRARVLGTLSGDLRARAPTVGGSEADEVTVLVMADGG